MIAVLKNIRWYLGAVMGEQDYPRYVAHLKAAHPGAPIPTEREFWRARWAEQDASPGARCC